MDTSITNTWYSFKITGGGVGFFQGKSGIRQGYPLSPYLFVLSMEVLSRHMRVLYQDLNVSHHPKCRQLNLTHLLFADDLMIFVRGDVPSAKAVENVLSKFATVFGLYANADKTNIYFGGISPTVPQAILQDTGFSVGSFPFKYLGILLTG
ncbi:putative mitochondrial protein AtMg01250 [Silene latifolia]|uniref:putative mitochondrial protein AtMg01250 n=1 Tax=Silene latifolia TaxID=37657 RepID=UPI003D76FE34